MACPKKEENLSVQIVDEGSCDIFGRVHSIETAGTVDGPGVRYIVFLSGCPLFCQYCHNPDTRKLKDGEVKSAKEVVADIKSYASFLKRARGGITLSGGEPMVQPAFVEAIFRGAKELGLHTALDTTGYLGSKATDDLLSVTDLVLLDIKSGLPEVYEEVAGVKLQPTIDFAKRLSDIRKDMWIRFVLVPGLTDSEENVHAVAGIISSLETVKRVDILPFHKMGEYKYEHLGMEYKLKDTPAATEEDVERVRQIFAEYGIES